MWSTSQVWLPQAAPAPVPDSLVGQDRRLSPARPGFNSRSGNASRAPLAERSAVNRQVLGSIPSGGAYLLQFFLDCNFQKKGEMEPLAVAPRTHGATAARRIPDPKVGGSNPSGFSSILPFPFWISGNPRPNTKLGRGVRRYSIGAVPRLVAPVALVRFQVAAKGA